jgi:myo-inositol-1(or 4)-monophosphatase
MSGRNDDRSPAAARALEADWLELCRRVVAAQRQLFDRERGIAARTVYEGVGEGGDRALAIDRRSEDIVFAELERLAAQGAEFTAVSEERGEVAFGDGASRVRVVVDPIDGSLNARRTIPSHALSVAVASGPDMGAVELGYVYDFGAREEFFARRGAGARLDGVRLNAEGPGYGLEIVGLESAKPERIQPLVEALAGRAYRIRALGSIAISLCYVAAGRFDAMLTARACRSVDVAAAQLIAREAGAALAVSGPGLERASLGLDARYHVAAALEDEMLATVLDVQRRAEPAGIP